MFQILLRIFHPLFSTITILNALGNIQEQSQFSLANLPMSQNPKKWLPSPSPLTTSPLGIPWAFDPWMDFSSKETWFQAFEAKRISINLLNYQTDNNKILPFPHQNQNQLVRLYQEGNIHPSIGNFPPTKDAWPSIIKARTSSWMEALLHIYGWYKDIESIVGDNQEHILTNVGWKKNFGL